jgi:hypothetical protein
VSQNRHWWAILACFLQSCILVVFFVPEVRSQESPSFVMDRVTVSAIAARTSSARFDLAVTFAQEVPVGGASFCNAGFVADLGFWSLLGGGRAPILLTVDHSPMAPEDVDLRWTGSAETFGVYRSSMPEDIALPSSLTRTTSECSAPDSPPVEPAVIYYIVIPQES